MEGKKKERIMTIGIIVLVVIAIISVIGVMVTKKKPVEQEEKPTEVEEGIQEDTRPSDGRENFEFTLESVKYESESTEFVIKVTNQSEESKYLNEFVATVKDGEGNEIAGVYGIIGEEIKGKESTTMSCYYGGDISNFASIEYKIEK